MLKGLLANGDLSDSSAKYCLIAIQFLLHAKTAAQWQTGADKETEEATNLLLSFLLDGKKKKAQK